MVYGVEDIKRIPFECGVVSRDFARLMEGEIIPNLGHGKLPRVDEIRQQKDEGPPPRLHREKPKCAGQAVGSLLFIRALGRSHFVRTLRETGINT